MLIALSLLAVGLPLVASAQDRQSDQPTANSIATSPTAPSSIRFVVHAPEPTTPTTTTVPSPQSEANPAPQSEAKSLPSTTPRSMRSGTNSRWTVPAARTTAARLAQSDAKLVPSVPEPKTPPEPDAKVNALIANILEAETVMNLNLRRSKLIRTKAAVTRFAVTQPDTLDVVQYSPTEFELIALQAGETTLTLWFGEEALRYVVRIAPDAVPEQRAGMEYGDLQKKINEMFPNSMVQLIPLADKLIVRGQAKDSEEAAHILSVLSGQAINQTGAQLGPGSLINLGTTAKTKPGSTDLPATNIISLLDVPGEQQIMLKVRVAELNRTALRQMGCDLTVKAGDFTLQSLLGGSQVFNAVLSTDEVTLALRALATNTYSKILAEPNLVTLNGQSASFLAGGEFAVPTVVGVEGVAAVSTQFRGFGTQLTFTPTIIDKDRIRLTVAPSFSTLNQDLSVQGIPGLNSRAVLPTVDLREGQWLAIAGLLQDQQSGSKVRVPLIGDIPVVSALFSNRKVTRDETELVVLVSPELIHPMDAQEAPLILPGMETTEPTDWAFFLGGAYEGRANCDHRSTVWPTRQSRVLEAKGEAVREAKGRADYQRSEKYYLYGSHGLSR